MVIVCSAVLTVLPPGVFMTTMPRRVAAATSMLSTPTPARTTARSLPGLSSNSAVTSVWLRTMTASAARTASCRAAPLRPLRSSSSMPAWRSNSRPAASSLALRRTGGMITSYLLRQPLGQHLLGRSQAAARFHLVPHFHEHQLHARQPRQHIELVDVTHVRQPDDLALELVLAARQLQPVLLL